MPTLDGYADTHSKEALNIRRTAVKYYHGMDEKYLISIHYVITVFFFFFLKKTGKVESYEGPRLR